MNYLRDACAAWKRAVFSRQDANFVRYEKIRINHSIMGNYGIFSLCSSLNSHHQGILHADGRCWQLNTFGSAGFGGQAAKAERVELSRK